MIPTLTRRRTLAPWQWLGLWAASLILTAVLLPVGIVQLRGTTGGAYAGAGNTASGQAASGQAASGPGVSGQAGLGNANTADPASSRAFPQAASQSQAANPKQIAHAPAHSADASTSNRDTAADADLPQDNLSVPVLSSQTGRVRHYALETYVAGVVAGEMPADFDPEALKAQAVAARTYAVYKWGQHAEGSGSDTESAPGVAGDPPSGKPGTSDNSGSAWSGNNALHDTVLDQDFLTDQELRKEWGSDYENYRKKILQAVTATQGEILTYNHRPILAAYFSTSNGFTEDASAVWGKSFPYLRSLPSPWDIRSPKYASTVEFTMDDIAAKLGISRGISSRDLLKGIQVLSRTEGRRIGSIRIGGKTFTGREVRDRLGLASADFAFVADGSKIRVQVRGDGHGVGMSQWGAQELALQGYTASQILAYYYAGTSKELLPGSLGKLETPTLPSE